jgi:hypothetical protein
MESLVLLQSNISTEEFQRGLKKISNEYQLADDEMINFEKCIAPLNDIMSIWKENNVSEQYTLTQLCSSLRAGPHDWNSVLGNLSKIFDKRYGIGFCSSFLSEVLSAAAKNQTIADFLNMQIQANGESVVLFMGLLYLSQASLGDHGNENLRAFSGGSGSHYSSAAHSSRFGQRSNGTKEVLDSLVPRDIHSSEDRFEQLERLKSDLATENFTDSKSGEKASAGIDSGKHEAAPLAQSRLIKSHDVTMEGSTHDELLGNNDAGTGAKALQLFKETKDLVKFTQDAYFLTTNLESIQELSSQYSGLCEKIMTIQKDVDLTFQFFHTCDEAADFAKTLPGDIKVLLGYYMFSRLSAQQLIDLHRDYSTISSFDSKLPKPDSNAYSTLKKCQTDLLAAEKVFNDALLTANTIPEWKHYDSMMNALENLHTASEVAIKTYNDLKDVLRVEDQFNFVESHKAALSKYTVYAENHPRIYNTMDQNAAAVAAFDESFANTNQRLDFINRELLVIRNHGGTALAKNIEEFWMSDSGNRLQRIGNMISRDFSGEMSTFVKMRTSFQTLNKAIYEINEHQPDPAELSNLRAEYTHAINQLNDLIQDHGPDFLLLSPEKDAALFEELTRFKNEFELKVGSAFRSETQTLERAYTNAKHEVDNAARSLWRDIISNFGFFTWLSNWLFG